MRSDGLQLNKKGKKGIVSVYSSYDAGYSDFKAASHGTLLSPFQSSSAVFAVS